VLHFSVYPLVQQYTVLRRCSVYPGIQQCNFAFVGLHRSSTIYFGVFLSLPRSSTKHFCIPRSTQKFNNVLLRLPWSTQQYCTLLPSSVYPDVQQYISPFLSLSRNLNNILLMFLGLPQSSAIHFFIPQPIHKFNRIFLHSLV
jgi:hypothetical protein